MVLIEHDKQMVGVHFAQIFDSKVVHDQDELDQGPDMAPETWCGDCLMVTSGVEPLACKRRFRVIRRCCPSSWWAEKKPMTGPLISHGVA